MFLLGLVFFIPKSPAIIYRYLIVLCLLLFLCFGCDEASVWGPDETKDGRQESFVFDSLNRATKGASVGEKTSSGDSAANLVAAVPFALSASVPPEQDADNICSRLLPGSPRGLSCLHCTQPEARNQARVLVNTLLQSCVKNVAISFLVDGTFGFDEGFLKEQIDTLSASGRKLFISFYLLNGATQRQWKGTSINAVGTKTPPEEFRKRLFSDTKLQSDIQQLVLRLLPVIRHAKHAHSDVTLILALEDNLTDKAFAKLSEIVSAVVPTTLMLRFGRNACVGCYPGNQGGIEDGYVEEVHTLSAAMAKSVADGIVSNDGLYYSWDEESAADSAGGTLPTLQDLGAVRDAAQSKNNAFLLWTGEFQGRFIVEERIPIHPSRRNYVMPAPRQISRIMEFLRAGR
ncbi:MAG: hypothetical protein IT291_02345 [Deltaproteobacteria bacterium]|nr:hypothetical protein [Deltaproteobacteria bacterium]